MGSVDAPWMLGFAFWREEGANAAGGRRRRTRQDDPGGRPGRKGVAVQHYSHLDRSLALCIGQVGLITSACAPAAGAAINSSRPMVPPPRITTERPCSSSPATRTACVAVASGSTSAAPASLIPGDGM